MQCTQINSHNVSEFFGGNEWEIKCIETKIRIADLPLTNCLPNAFANRYEHCNVSRTQTIRFIPAVTKTLNELFTN